MEIQELKCPHCGASLRVREGQKYIKCEYCDSELFLSGVENRPGPGQVREGESLRETPTGSTGEPDSGKRGYRPLSSRQTGHAESPDHGREAKDRKYSILPPPGFRSRNIAHMLTAVIGYLFIIVLALNLDTGLDAVFFVLASMTVVDICTGWSGLYARLPGIRHPSTAVRILAKVLWSMLTFLAWIVILVLVQMLLT